MANVPSPSPEQRLRDLGIELPSPPEPLGAYVRTVQSGRLLFFSGMLPIVDRQPKYLGQIGNQLDTQSGCDALYVASLNALAAARDHLGTLDRVKRVVKLGVYLVTTPEFTAHPEVADAASELFESIFGKEQTSVRIVLGVASLPLGVPVELEVVLEVAE